MTRRPRASGYVGLALAACLAFADARAAELPVATEPAQPLHVRAKAVLDAHCVLCRELDQTADGAIPDLDTIAGDPGLVRPGRPDVSPLYQRMLSAPPPRGAEETPDVAAPSPEDIEIVRDWIASLPPREAGCRGRTPVSADDVTDMIRRWTEAVGAEEAAATRFVSLAHLWNACAAPMRMMELRIATATLLGALTGSREELQLETVGDKSVLLAIRPDTGALAAAGWDRLTADAPLSASGAVPADWLAAHVLRRRTEADVKMGAIGQAVLDGVGERAVSALARHWTRDVDLVRAAAERGLSPDELRKMLMKEEGDLLLPSRRLAYGAVSRDVWQRMARALGGGAKARIEDVQGMDRAEAVDVVLWPDQPSYRPRDLVTFNVRVDKACHLTLIGVDGAGQATVLFPNELEPENLVAPAVTVQVPGNAAGYQFRFDKAGEETIVAICQRGAWRPEGIAYDYERQRFALLGDWRTFLRTAEARKKEIRARREAAAARRKRRGREPVEKEPPPVAPAETGVEGRAAITIVVEPGGGRFNAEH
ncbi:MAG TPA: DUF4384 domain-containing protein [Hyphomicrobium sp.]|nr:DUF4384 domain-containing protein [Hyphomicrobium sp.]HRO49299.1 DUF4384 domain-containing protein [Hyphomicrobium sp.]